MSRDWLKQVEPRRAEARKRFALFDDQTIPVSLADPIRIEELKPTSAIIITGYIPIRAARFAINFLCKTPGNIAFHFNPRLDRSYVVRNSKSKNSWQDEETHSPSGANGFVFKRNSYFHLMIFCTISDFQVAVDGEHFCSFWYRVPLPEIEALLIDGDLEETKVRQTNLYVYPDPKICRPLRSFIITDDRPLKNNLELPLVIEVPKSFPCGGILFIKGRLKLLPHSFIINLQKNKAIYPHPVIAFHLNPRFHYGNVPTCVVMNYWINGAWGSEERHEGNLSWMPGREFLLTIRCEIEGFTIWLGKKMISEFKHRMEPTIIDTLRISGDIVLQQVAITY